MKNNIILIDIDDVVANLIDGWLAIYNNISGDHLTQEAILDWDISKYVKTGYESIIYSILENPRIYDTIKPVDGALSGTNRLIESGYRLVYVTSPIIKTAGTKFTWLFKNGFSITEKNYVEAQDKSLIFGDFMIDDGIHNIESTIAKNALLFTKPWNKNYQTVNRVNNWQEILRWFGVA